MYLSMKSRMVSQRAAKVGRDSRGERCWRKTWRNKRDVRDALLVERAETKKRKMPNDQQPCEERADPAWRADLRHRSIHPQR